MIMVAGRKRKGKKRTETKRRGKKPSTALTTTKGDSGYLEIYPELRPIANKIRKLQAKISGRQRMNLIDSMEAGDLLIQAKKKINYGDWVPWLEEGPGVGPRHSQIWMRRARYRDVIQKYLLDPRNEPDSFLTTPEPRGEDADRIIKAIVRENKKIRSEEPYAKILDDVRRAGVSKTWDEHRKDAHEETEEELEESLERSRIETAILRKAWESVSHASIRDFIDNLVQEGLFPYQSTESLVSGPEPIDEDEQRRADAAAMVDDQFEGKLDQDYLDREASGAKQRPDMKVKKKGKKSAKRKKSKK